MRDWRCASIGRGGRFVSGSSLDSVPDLLGRCINLDTKWAGEGESLGCGLDVPYRSRHGIAWIFGWAVSRVDTRPRRAVLAHAGLEDALVVHQHSFALPVPVSAAVGRFPRSFLIFEGMTGICYSPFRHGLART